LLNPGIINTSKTSDRSYFLIWLVIISVIGCALKVFHLVNIPFSYDELSALHRTHYASLHQLIAEGIAVDGHPAGVQIFLFYWTKLIGETEWLVKLPFIIMGILCIPLIYRIGSRWFTRDAGIIAATLVAGLQYTVMYSQIARPYISGLFFILLLVAIWNELIVKITFRNLIAYAIVLALCAYNHYFSLLTAACIVITGFFVINRKELFKYTLSVLLALIFFLPHIPLFFTQLKLKGLEWLSVPGPSFFGSYLYYIFNFSTYIVVALAFLIAQGIYLSIKRNEPWKYRYQIMAFLWFVIPAVIGYLYSVYRAPVLQYSVLIFSFPFLILFVCSFITLPRFWLRSVEISLLLLVLVGSLVWERKYYEIFYHQETEMFAKHISGYELAFGNAQVGAVVRTERSYLNYYKSKYKTDWRYQTFDAIGDSQAWRKWLAACDKKYLVLCNPPVEFNCQYLAIAKEYFPCVDSIYRGFTTDIYILKRDTASCRTSAAPLFQFRLDQSNEFSTRYKLPPFTGSGENVCLICDSPDIHLFRSLNQPLWLNEKVMINASLEVYLDSTKPDGRLRLQFKDKDGTVLQTRESLFRSFAGTDTGWCNIYLTARLYHSPVSNALSKPIYLSVDLLKGDSTCVKFKNFKIEAVPDNPVLYSLIKK
jgi:hypothetical protein